MRWPPPDDWPFASLSKHVTLPGTKWHVQERPGDGPLTLLLHGTGASTHSFAPLVERLKGHLVMVDLPGHGYTRARRVGRTDMRTSLTYLLKQQDWKPKRVIGHSAGAVLMIDLALKGALQPNTELTGINASIAAFPGPARWLFPAAARALSYNPLVAPLASLGSSPNAIRRLVASTGSNPDLVRCDLYLRLMRNTDHLRGALGMMAGWDLERFLETLPSLRHKLHLITGANDRTVPAKHSAKLAKALPNVQHSSVPEFGHLVHEENPAAVAALIEAGRTG